MCIIFTYNSKWEKTTLKVVVVTCDKKILRTPGPKVWNQLLNHGKELTSLFQCKNFKKA